MAQATPPVKASEMDISASYISETKLLEFAITNSISLNLGFRYLEFRTHKS